MNTITINNTNQCNKCGRSLDGKGYIMVSGMKICGICQFEINSRKSTFNLETKDDYPTRLI